MEFEKQASVTSNEANLTGSKPSPFPATRSMQTQNGSLDEAHNTKTKCATVEKPLSRSLSVGSSIDSHVHKRFKANGDGNTAEEKAINEKDLVFQADEDLKTVPYNNISDGTQNSNTQVSANYSNSSQNSLVAHNASLPVGTTDQANSVSVPAETSTFPTFLKTRVRVCMVSQTLLTLVSQYFDQDDDNHVVEALCTVLCNENRPSIFYLLRGLTFGPEHRFVVRRKHWWNPWSEKVMRKEIVVKKIDTKPGCRSILERFQTTSENDKQDLMVMPMYTINMWIVSLITVSGLGSVLIGLWMRLTDPSFAHGMLLNLTIGSIGSLLYLLSNTWCR
ncbi:meiotically upregulated Mug97 [Schizosaccharomyces japonicus yFS275]|uniref:Meiotically upregulated Mug97 n=1 Tax=Schizosaccharomyces japonicus (strain yFS275 / FY16936) TaxID=402676 RepID=B6K5M3_SCHJY|nr:meiotically upregulated Mug97 [Schizosaccharomyces japonicus yFS275]EEB08827.2 meiotically upregulated Mug97 [Schizosaccharomyces japonicus yFS275]